MIKTLIVDDDLNYAKYILNVITNRFNNINVSHIATDGQEALNIISSNHFDLIFLDLKMPIMNGIEVVKAVNNLNYVIKPKFIIISGDLPSIVELTKYNDIAIIINKLETDESICKKIESIINETHCLTQLPQVKEYVISQLLNFGYNFKLRGTNYIMESILYIYTNNNMNLLDNLEQNVFKYIAYRNKKTLLNVKTSITKATNTLPNSHFSKVTPKSIITIILIQLFNKFA